MDRFLGYLARGPVLIFFGCATALMYALILKHVADIRSMTGQTTLDFGFIHTVKSVETVVGAYTEKAKTVYASMQTLDMFFPFLYGSFLAGLIFKAWQGSKLRFLALFGALAAIGDLTENMFLKQIVGHYPDITPDMIAGASAGSVTKWSFMGLAILMVIVGWLRARNKKSLEA